MSDRTPLVSCVRFGFLLFALSAPACETKEQPAPPSRPSDAAAPVATPPPAPVTAATTAARPMANPAPAGGDHSKHPHDGAAPR